MSLRGIRRSSIREDICYFLIIALTFTQLLVAPQSSSKAAEAKRMNVIAFSFAQLAPEAPPGLANAVRDAIAAQMIDTGKYSVRTAYEGDPTIHRAIKEQLITPEEVELAIREPTVERAVSLGKLIQADAVLLGSLDEFKLEEVDGGVVTITVSVQLISVETGQPVPNGDVKETITRTAKKPPIEIAKEALIKQAVLDLARIVVDRFLGKPPVEVKPPKRAAPAGAVLPVVLLAAAIAALAGGKGRGAAGVPAANMPSDVAVYPEASGVRIVWMPPTAGTVVEYRIYRQVVGIAVTRQRAAAGGWQLLARVPATQTQYVDATATPPTLYRYGVSAVFEDGRESPIIQPPPDGSGMPPAVAIGVPTTPRGFKATAGDRWVRLTWQPNTEGIVVGYRLFRLEEPRDLTPQDRPIADEGTLRQTAAEFIDDNAGKGLVNGKVYFYRLVAVGQNRYESMPTPVQAATPGDYEPQPPRNLVAVGRDREIELRWEPSPDPDVVKYQVLRGEESLDEQRSPHMRVIRPTPMPPNIRFPQLREIISRVRAPQMHQIAEVVGRLTTQYIDRNVVNARFRYWYAVRAVDQGGKVSDLSNIATAVANAKPITPPPPQIAKVTEKSVTLDLQNVVNAALRDPDSDIVGVRIFRGLAPGQTQTAVLASLNKVLGLQDPLPFSALQDGRYFVDDGRDLPTKSLQANMQYFYAVQLVDKFGLGSDVSPEVSAIPHKPPSVIELPEPIVDPAMSANGKSMALIMAKVLDKDGQPVGGVDVKFTLDPQLGGFVEYTPELAAQITPLISLGSLPLGQPLTPGGGGRRRQAGAPQLKSELVAQTDTQGIARVIYVAPELNQDAVVRIIATVVEEPKLTKSLAITLVAPKPTSITMTATPQILTADGVTQSDIKVVVRDAFAELMKQQGVKFTITAGPVGGGASDVNGWFLDKGNKVPEVSVNTDDNGEATAIYQAGTKIGRVVITARCGQAQANITIELVAGLPSQVIVQATPTELTADGRTTSQITATVYDAKGNPVKGVELTFAASVGSVAPESATTDENGKATAVYTAGTKVGTAVVTARAKINGAEGKAEITLKPGVAATIQATAYIIDAQGNKVQMPSSGIFVSNVGMTPNQAIIDIIVTDATGNPVKDTVVTLQAVGGTVTQSVRTDENGHAEATFTSGTASGQAQVTMTAAGVSQSLTIPLRPGPPHFLTVSVAQASLPADGASVTTISAIVSDANNNRVEDGNEVRFTIEGNALGAQFGDGKTQTVAVTQNGVANVMLRSGTQVGAIQILVQALHQGQEKARQVVKIDFFQVTVASIELQVSQSTLSVSDTNSPDPNERHPLRTDIANRVTATATVRGIDGKPLLNRPDVQLLFTVSDSNVLLIDADNQQRYALGALTKNIDAATGQARVILVASRTAGPIVLTAVSERVVQSVNLTQLPGVPARIEITAFPQTIPADGISTSQITVQVWDANDNPVANGTAVQFSTSAGTVKQPVAWTVDGKASTILTSQLSKTPIQAVVEARVEGILQPAKTTVVFGVTIATLVSMRAEPSTIVGDGISEAKIYATFTDEKGNPVADGMQVYFETTFGRIVSATPTQNGTAVATLRSAIVTQPKVVQVTAVLINPDGSRAVGTVNVTFTPAREVLIITAAPPTLVADGVSTSTITARLVDLDGKPVQGVAVRFTTSLGSIKAVTDVTDANGTATATLTAGSKAGIAIVTVRAATAEASIDVPILPGAAQFIRLTTYVPNPPLYADGFTQLKVIAEVTDANGNWVIPGTQVTFTQTDAAGNQAVQIAQTDDRGQASVFFTSTVAGKAVILATSGAANAQIAVTYLPSVILTMDITPAIITADGTSTATVTVLAKNAQGNPLPNILVRFQASHGTITDQAATDAQGIATATYTAPRLNEPSTVATIIAVARFLDGTEQRLSGIITLQGVGAGLSIAANPPSLPADGKSEATIRVVALDTQNRPVKGLTVKFTTTAGTLSNESAQTGADGTATVKLIAPTFPTTATVTATIPPTATIGGTSMARTDVTFNPVTVVMSADSNVLPADGTSETTVRARLIDTSGLPVADGLDVTFSASEGSISPAVSKTINGVATAVYKAGKRTVVATVTGQVISLGISGSLSITLVPTAANRVVMVSSSPRLIADGNDVVSIEARVYDVSGNMAMDGTVVCIKADGGTFGGVGTDIRQVHLATANGVAVVDLRSEEAKVITVEGFIDNDRDGVIDGGTVGGQVKIEAIGVGAGVTVTLSRDMMPADGLSRAKVRVSVRDAQGKAIGGISVKVTSDMGRVEPSELKTDTNGVAEAELVASTAGGLATVVASCVYQGVERVGSASLTMNPVVIRLSSSVSELSADGQSQAVITALVSDTSGLPVSDGLAIKFAATNGTVLPEEAKTAGGIARAIYIASKQAGVVTITARAADLNIAQSLTITLLPGMPQVVVATASSPTLPADSVSTVVITANVYDAAGNSAADGTLVSFVTDAGTFGATGTDIKQVHLPTVGGSCSATLRTAQSGIITVNVFIDMNRDGTPDIGTKGAKVVIQAIPVPASIVLTLTKTQLPADGTSKTQIIAAVRDTQGNPIGGVDVAFTTTFGHLTKDTEKTNQNGITPEIELVAPTVPGVATITASAVINGAIAVGSAVVTFNAVSIVVTTDKAQMNADGTSKATITARLLDSATGVPVADGIYVDFWTDNGQVNPARSQTANGVASCTYTAGVRAGVAIVTAEVMALGISGNVSINLRAKEASVVVVDANPYSIPADGNSVSQIMATVLDSDGNLVQDGTVVTFTTNLGTFGPRLSDIRVVQATTVNGQAVVNLRSLTKSGLATVVAFIDRNGNKRLDAGEPSGQAIVEMAAIAAGLTLSVDRLSMPADGVSLATIQATLRDPLGRVMDASSVSFSTNGGKLVNRDDSEAKNGVVRIQLQSDIVPGTATVVAVAKVDGAEARQSVDIVMNPLVLSLVADRDRLRADGNDSTVLRARVMDTANNVVDGVNAEFSVDNGQVNPKDALVRNGEATATLIASNVSGVANVRVRVLRYVAATQVTYVPVDIARVNVSAAPIEIPVGASASSISVTVLDSSNRPVEGAVVTFSTDKGFLIVGQGITNAAGIATATLYSDTTVGEATVTATATYEGKVATGQVKVRFIPGSAARITIEVRNSRGEVVDPNEKPVEANNVDYYELIAHVTDQYGNPVRDGTVVTWKIDPNFRQTAQGGVSTTQNGKARNEILSSVFCVGQVAAIVDPIFATTQLVFVPGPPVTVVANAIPPVIEAGVGEAIITARAFDAQKNPINIELGGTPGVGVPNVIKGKRSVDFIFSTNAGLLDDLESGVNHEIGTTVTVKGDTIVDNGGIATVKLIAGSTANTNATITVKAGTAVGTVSVAFVPSEAAQLVVTAQPQQIPGNMIATSTLRVEVRDEKGNPVRDETPVQFEIESGNVEDGVFLPSNGTRQTALTSGGVATVVYRSGLNILDGTKNVSIKVASGKASIRYSITLQSAKPHSATLVANPSTIPANGLATSTITATVRDANGNPVPIGTVVVFKTDNATFVNATSGDGKEARGATDVNGVVVVTLRSSTRAGIAKVWVDEAIVNGTTVTLTQVGSTTVQMIGVQAVMTLVSDKASLPADGTSYATLTLTLRDAQGNPIVTDPTKDEDNIRFTTTGGTLKTLTGADLPINGVDTDANGTVKVRLVAPFNPGAATVTATFARDGVVTRAQEDVVFHPLAIRVVANPDTIRADGISTSTIMAFLQDAVTSEPVAQGTLVTFTTTLGTITAADESPELPGIQVSVKGYNGQVTATLLSSHQPGVATVTASVGTSSGSGNITLIGAPANITLTAVPAQIRSGGMDTSTITAQVVDAAGNPVWDGTLITFQTTLGTLSPDEDGNPANGAQRHTVGGRTFVLLTSGNEVGIATVSAKTENDVVASALVQITSGAPASIALVAEPDRIVADGVTGSRIIATVKDANGNPVVNAPVYFSTTLGTIVPQVAITNSQGIAAATLTSTSVGVANVTATSGPVSSRVTVTVIKGVPATVTLSSNVDEVYAHGVGKAPDSATVTVTVRDANNAPVDGVPVFLTTTLGSITSSVTTNAQGTATATFTSGLQSGDAVITAQAGSIAASLTIKVKPGAPEQVVLSANPNVIFADGVSTSRLTATVLDKNGNPVEDGTQVEFKATAGTIIGSPAATANGQAQATLRSTTSETNVTVTATANGKSDSTIVRFAKVEPAAIQLSAQPSSLSVGGIAGRVTQSKVTAVVLDAQGRRVANGTPVVLRTSKGNFVESGQPTYEALTSNGQVVATLDVSGENESGIALVTAESGQAVASLSIPVQPGPPTAITLTAMPSSIPADGVSSCTLIARVQDQYGNPVPNQPVAFSTTRGNINPVTATTNVLGIASATLTSVSSSVDIVVAVTAQSGNTTATVTVTFTAVRAASITLTANPPTIPADDTTTSTITAVVNDANGNPVPDGTTVTFVTDFGEFTNGLTTQDVGTLNGRANVALRSRAWLAGIAHVTATSGNVSQTVTVTITAGMPALVELSAMPEKVPADNQTAAIVRAEVRDIAGNPVSGAIVTFSTTLGTFTNAQVSTDAQGVAVTQIRSNRVGTATITAVSGSASSVQVQVEFITPAATIQLVAAPTTIKADGGQSRITATVMDGFGKPVPDGTVVRFSIPSANHGRLQPDTDANPVTEPVKTANGQASVTLIGSVNVPPPGVCPVTAEADTATGVVRATVEVVLAKEPARIMLTAIPSSIRADGTSTSQIRALVTDENNHAVADGTPIKWKAAAGRIDAQTTTVNGEARATLTSSPVPQAKPVTVTAFYDANNNNDVDPGEAFGTVDVIFSAGPAASLMLTAQPQTQVADGVSVVQLKAIIKDELGNPVADGTAVIFQTNLGTFVGAPAPGTAYPTSTVNGEASASLISNQTGLATVTVQVGLLARQVVVSFKPGQAASVALSANPAVVFPEDGREVLITATVLDRLNNPVEDGTMVEFTVTAYDGTDYTANLRRLDGAYSNIVSTVSGLAQIKLVRATKNDVGIYTVRANALSNGNVLASALTQVRFAGEPAELIAAANPTVIIADGRSTSTITVTARDILGMPVADGTVINFTTTSGSVTSTGRTVGGQVVATLTSSMQPTPPNAPAVVTAWYDADGDRMPSYGFEPIATVEVVFTTGAPARVTLTATPTQVVADGISTSTIVATVVDALNRPVIDGVQVTFTTNLGTFPNGQPAFTTVTSGGTGQASAILTSPRAPGVANVTATVAGITSTPVTISFVPGEPASIILTASPMRLKAGTSMTSLIMATLRDANGNPVADGTEVTFEVSGTSQFITSIPALTRNGVAVATLRGDETNPAPRRELITAKAKTSSGYVSNIIEIPFIGAPQYVTLTAAPTTITADGTSTARITATIFDAAGNPVYDGTVVEWSVVPTPPDLTVRISGDGSTSNGVATATLRAPNRPGSAAVTVTATETGVQASITIRFIPNAIAQITITAEPPEIDVLGANGIEATTITAVVTDAAGNPAPDGTIVFFSATSGTIEPAKPTQGGIARATLASSTIANNNVVVTAQTNGVSAQTTVKFRPGPARRVSLTATPNRVVANGYSQIAITARIVDVNGNNVADATPVWFFATQDNHQPGMFIGGTYDHAQNRAQIRSFTQGGVATAVLRSSKTAGTVTIVAQAFLITDETGDPNNLPPAQASGNVQVVYESGVPAAVQVSVDPRSIYVSGVGVEPSSAIITAFVLDTDGIPVEGGTATFSIAANQGTLTDEYGNDNDGSPMTETVTIGVGDKAGIAKARITAGTIAGTVTISVAATKLSVTATGVGSIIYMPGPVHTIVCFANPTAIPADGTSVTTISAIVRDAHGNAIPSVTVTFVSDIGTIPVPQSVTDSRGIATTTLRSVASDKTVTATVTARSGDKSATTQVTFSSVLADTIVLAANPMAIVADDGQSAMTVTATVTARGQPVPDGTMVTFSVSSGSIDSAQTPDEDAAAPGWQRKTIQGVAVIRLMSGRVAGPVIITATSGTAFANLQVTFLPGPPDESQCTISPNPSTIPADGTTPSTITVTVLDRFQNPIPGVVVDFTAVGGTVTPAQSKTNAQGVATTRFTSTTQGQATVTANFGGIVKSVNVTVEAAPVASITLSFSYPNLYVTGVTVNGQPVGTPTLPTEGTVTATVRDVNGNPVGAGILVTFSTTLGAVEASAMTTAGGTAQVKLTAGTTSGIARVRAAVGSITGTIDIPILPGDAASIMLSGVPTVIPADGRSTAAITAVVRDANNNPVRDGTRVEFFSRDTKVGYPPAAGDPPGNPMGTITAKADTINGAANATLVSRSSVVRLVAYVSARVRVGATYVYSDSIPGNATLDPLEVTFEPVAAATLTLSAEPSKIYVSGVGLIPTTSLITAQVLDAAGNPVPDGTIVNWMTDRGALQDPDSGLPSDQSATAGGVAKIQLVSGPLSGRATVTAVIRDPNNNPILSQSIQVEFMPGLPAPYPHSTISPNPPTISGNGIANSTITVTLRDANGNPVVDGTKVAFVTNHGTIMLARGYEQGTVGGVSMALLISEVVAVDTDAYVKANAPAGSPFFIGTDIDGSQLGGQHCIVTMVKSIPTTISASIDNARLTPDGVSKANITVRVADQFGLPVPDGTVIDFSVDLGTVTTPSVTKNGTASAVYTAGTTPGIATISITVHDYPHISTGLQVYLPGGVVKILMGYNPAVIYEPSIWADGVDRQQVVAQCIDRFGNPVNEVDIIWTTTAGSITPATDRTGPRTITGFRGGAQVLQGASIATLVSQRSVAGLSATVTAIVPNGETGVVMASTYVGFTGVPTQVDWEWYNTTTGLYNEPVAIYAIPTTPPGRIHIRIRIRDQNGTNVPDGTSVTFAIYTTSGGDGGSLSNASQTTSNGWTHPWLHYGEGWGTAATISGGTAGRVWRCVVEATVSTPYGSLTFRAPGVFGHD